MRHLFYIPLEFENKAHYRRPLFTFWHITMILQKKTVLWSSSQNMTKGGSVGYIVRTITSYLTWNTNHLTFSLHIKQRLQFNFVLWEYSKVNFVTHSRFFSWLRSLTCVTDESSLSIKLRFFVPMKKKEWKMCCFFFFYYWHI